MLWARVNVADSLALEQPEINPIHL